MAKKIGKRVRRNAKKVGRAVRGKRQKGKPIGERIGSDIASSFTDIGNRHVRASGGKPAKKSTKNIFYRIGRE